MSTHQVSPNFIQKKRHHGIPVVPFAKRSAKELSRPVIYIECEMDPIDLPFGDDGMAANFEVIRRKRKRSESSIRFRRNCLIFFLVLVLSGVAWYFKTLFRSNIPLPVELDFEDNSYSLDNILDDLYLSKDSQTLRRL